MLVNGEDLRLNILDKEEAENVFGILRVIFFALKANIHFKSVEHILETSDYLWNKLGSVTFAKLEKLQWFCTCGAKNEFHSDKPDESCQSCFSSRNYVLINGNPNLVELSLTKGNVTADDVVLVYPWFTKERYETFLVGAKRSAKGSLASGIGCLIFSMIVFIVSLIVLFSRPSEWKLPSFVVIIFSAIGLAGIKGAWNMIRDSK